MAILAEPTDEVWERVVGWQAGRGELHFDVLFDRGDEVISLDIAKTRSMSGPAPIYRSISNLPNYESEAEDE